MEIVPIKLSLSLSLSLSLYALFVHKETYFAVRKWDLAPRAALYENNSSRRN